MFSMKNVHKVQKIEIKMQTSFFLCPWGKKRVVNHFSKLNSFRDMNFQKWSITDESWRLSVSYTFMNDSSVIDHFWKFISRKLLSFEKWFNTHFLPHGHRKKMSAFLFLFSTLLVNIFHAKPQKAIVNFFLKHPVYTQNLKNIFVLFL